MNVQRHAWWPVRVYPGHLPSKLQPKDRDRGSGAPSFPRAPPHARERVPSNSAVRALPHAHSLGACAQIHDDLLMIQASSPLCSHGTSCPCCVCRRLWLALWVRFSHTLPAVYCTACPIASQPPLNKHGAAPRRRGTSVSFRATAALPCCAVQSPCGLRCFAARGAAAWLAAPRRPTFWGSVCPRLARAPGGTP